MMYRKQTRFIRKLLYTLKKGFGFTITLHKVTDESLNHETGQRTPTIITKRIEKAIILPATSQMKFEFGGAYNKANANFTYGALYTTALRRVIIDAQDVLDFEIEENDYFIWDEKRWQISKVDDLEYETAFTLTARMVKGSVRHMVEEIALESQIQLTSTVTET